MPTTTTRRTRRREEERLPDSLLEGTRTDIGRMLEALTLLQTAWPPSPLRQVLNAAVDRLRVLESLLAQGCQCTRPRRVCPLHAPPEEPAP